MDDKFPPRTLLWPSMRERPFYDGIKDMMIQREPDGEIGSLYITIPNPDYKPAKYKEYEKQLGHSRRYENTNHPVKKTIEPTPPYEPISDEKFKKILIEYGVTKNPETNFNYIGKKTTGDNDRVTEKNKTVSNNLASSSVLGAGGTLANTNNDQKPTPTMIYAKKCYGIEYADFTDAKFNTKAKVDLGIDDKNKLIQKNERENNFELFKKKHFSNEDNFENYSGIEPEPKTKAYKEIRDYSLSEYGSLMIRRVLTESKEPRFIIGTQSGSRARGESERNFIIIPPNFPSLEYFEVSKQKISGVAILHHEFEHTQYGDYDNPKSIEEERLAVRYKENPVRIINGLEPRYVYYDYYTNKTVNILTGEIKSEKYTYNKKDPSAEMIKVK